METINDRIKILIEDYYKSNGSSFCRDNNILQGSLSNVIGTRNSTPSYEITVKILSNKKLNINPNWFILGIGEISNKNIEDENNLLKADKQDTHLLHIESIKYKNELIEQMRETISVQRELIKKMKSERN